MSRFRRRLRGGLLATLLIGAAGGSLRAQQPAVATSLVRGAVVDSAGAPVAGAEVELVGTAIRAVANDSGTFRLVDVPASARALRVRRLGFAPVVVNLPTVLAAEHDVRIRLAHTAATLEAVTIEGRHAKPARYAATTRFDEFYRRRALGTGRFLTREEIEEMTASGAIDLLRIAPGVRVQRQPMGEAILKFPRCGQATVGTGSNGRAPRPRPAAGSAGSTSGVAGLGQGSILLFVDGLERSIDSITEYLASDVEAIEVYRSSIELPPEARGKGCAAIFIWSRYGG